MVTKKKKKQLLPAFLLRNNKQQHSRRFDDSAAGCMSLPCILPPGPPPPPPPPAHDTSTDDENPVPSSNPFPSSASGMAGSTSLTTWTSSSSSSSSSSSFSSGTLSGARPTPLNVFSTVTASSSSLLHSQVSSSAKSVVSDILTLEATGKVEKRFAMPPPFRDPKQELEEAFLRFDANRDGKISATELGYVLRSLGDNLSEKELQLMVKEVDKDGDGFIDFEEFSLLNSCAGGDQELRDAFHVFDADGNGMISAQELHQVLMRLGEPCTIEECRCMIRGVDTDGDGFVSFEEFCGMMSMH